MFIILLSVTQCVGNEARQLIKYKELSRFIAVGFSQRLNNPLNCQSFNNQH